MKFAFIASKEVAFPVLAMCKVLGVTRSGFYAWKKRPKSARAKADEQLVVDIAATHARSRKRYGSPRIHRALRKKGVRVGAKRVARLMRAANIVARQKRRFRRTTDSNHSNPIAPNILAREFDAARPNQAWVGDVTYIATGEGWSYLAVLLDLFSRRIVGVTLELLHQEYIERTPGGLRYTAFCDRYREWLTRRGLVMRQIHAAGDKLFVDYSGKKPHIIDSSTGEVIELELFVAVLGASNLTYAEVTWSQRGPDFIASHVRALEFFGGVPAALVPDQLKSGVTRSCRYEPEAQRTYEEPQRHEGTARSRVHRRSCTRDRRARDYRPSSSTGR